MKQYIIGVIAILLLVGCVYLVVQNRQLKKAKGASNELYSKLLNINQQYNEERGKELEKEFQRRDSIVGVYQKLYEDAKLQKETIAKKYNSIKNEISTTPDSGQLAITERLLAGYQNY